MLRSGGGGRGSKLRLQDSLLRNASGFRKALAPKSIERRVGASAISGGANPGWPEAVPGWLTASRPSVMMEPESGNPGSEVPSAMTRIAIYDTTLRDGSQGEGVNFSLQDKLRIVERLDDLGVDYIEGGYPLSNPKDEAFFRAVRDLDLAHAKVAAFGMTRRKEIAAEDDAGMKALVGSGASVVTIVGKSWDFQVTEVLGVSLDENLPDDRRLGRLLRQPGLRGRLRRRALLRRLPPGTPTTPSRPSRPPSPPAPTGWSSATPTAGRLPEGGRRCRRGGREGLLPSRSASTPTTTASWPSPTPWPPSGWAPRRSRGRSTGSASGAGTSTSAASPPTSP